MTTSTYTVVGMTCSHCVDAVSIEVAKLPGVTDVEVDLESGSVAVISTEALGEHEVAAAVEEAGYELAARPGGTG